MAAEQLSLQLDWNVYAPLARERYEAMLEASHASQMTPMTPGPEVPPDTPLPNPLGDVPTLPSNLPDGAPPPPSEIPSDPPPLPSELQSDAPLPSKLPSDVSSSIPPTEGLVVSFAHVGEGFSGDSCFLFFTSSCLLL